jgi:hypothetical protein
MACWSWRHGQSCSKVLYIVAVYSEYTRALTFQNFILELAARVSESAQHGRATITKKNRAMTYENFTYRNWWHGRAHHYHVEAGAVSATNSQKSGSQ